MSGAPAARWPYADLALARRLERAEASANAAFVEARAALQPEVGATWIDVAGTWAMFDGVGSPITQTFGLGVFEPVAAPQLETIERFFRERDAEVMHEVSPVAPAEVMPLLVERGYSPVELSSVLFQPLDASMISSSRGGDVRVREAGLDEESLWTETSAAGWGFAPELAEFMRGFGAISARARGNVRFIAEIDGEPVATAALALHEGVALLAGASTVPRWRGRGVQRALLDARLRFAMARGADLAMMGAAPGGTSQRNAEREGFRIAYTRTKWRG